MEHKNKAGRRGGGEAHSPFWKVVHCKDKQNQIKGSPSQSSPRNRRACVLFNVKTKLSERKHVLRTQEHCSLRCSTENRANAPQGQPAGGGTGHTSHFHLERISERPQEGGFPLPLIFYRHLHVCGHFPQQFIHLLTHAFIQMLSERPPSECVLRASTKG